MELVEQYFFFLSHVLVFVFNDNSSWSGVNFGLNAVCHSYLFSSLQGSIGASASSTNVTPDVCWLSDLDQCLWKVSVVYLFAYQKAIALMPMGKDDLLSTEIFTG